MKIWDPTFKTKELTANMDVDKIQHRNILLRARQFCVIDGDTIHALTPDKEKAFSIRFRSVNAAELPKASGTDQILRDAGMDTNPGNLALKSKKLLKTYLDDRAMLAVSSGKSDKYGRLLCDVYVVPYEGPKPNISRATSVERLMLEQRVTNPFRDERLPELLFTDTEICEFR